jgi:hypothetical protein
MVQSVEPRLEAHIMDFLTLRRRQLASAAHRSLDPAGLEGS